MFLGSSMNECKGEQGQAIWPDGENRDPEKGFMGNGLGFHGRGGARGLQGLVHQSQVSGWETPRRGQGAEIPWRVVNPRMAGRRREGMILLPGLRLPSGLSPREFFMARIASGEGACSWLGSLSNSDCDLLGGAHRRREGAQVSGLISEIQTQVLNLRGASSPRSLILSGVWGAQVVQESQGHSAPRPPLPRNSRYGEGPK